MVRSTSRLRKDVAWVLPFLARRPGLSSGVHGPSDLQPRPGQPQVVATRAPPSTRTQTDPTEGHGTTGRYDPWSRVPFVIVSASLRLLHAVRKAVRIALES